jgi:iron complex outermembrane recepter protein
MNLMKLTIAGILFCLFTSVYLNAQTTLSGKVLDKETGESLPGATLFIPDLKVGTAADQEGRYSFKNLPTSTIVLQASYIGYKAMVVSIDLSLESKKDIYLSSSAIEAQEVVVTGNALSSDNNRSSMSVTPINKEELLSIPSTNLINSIGKVPGVSEITTGGEVSKPVIRGLGYNHIVTINEGIRQEGNQWGDEHGIEIDQFSADRIEVLKGPASLFYGSDAMGGVINILEPVPARMNSIGGEYVSQIATNNKMFNSSVMFQGNQEGWIWRFRGSYKNAASFHTPDEWIYNSGFHELNYSAMVGVVKQWGYSHLHFSSFDSKIGMIDGTRDSLTHQFLDYQGNIVSDKQAESRSIEVPFQIVQHRKVSCVTNLLLGKNQVKLNLGYQSNDRREYGMSADSPGLYFHLDSWTYDGRYSFLALKTLELVAGISGMTQFNRNRGSEFLVPDYDLQDIGGFLYAKKSWTRFTVNVGMRFDSRYVEGYSLFVDSLGHQVESGDTLFKSFHSRFSALTGSVGMTFLLNKNINFKLNVGRGFRAPNIAELASNGVHEGTFRYEIGNPDLVAETSLQIDGEISWNTTYLNAVFSGFFNMIDKYIYPRNINDERKYVDGIWYPVYRYVQGNSLLKGFELEVDIHPIEQLHLDNNLDLVWGENVSTGVPLPQIPAIHLQDEIKWTWKTGKSKAIKSPFIEAELETHFTQDRIDPYETQTKGYVLLNASVGMKLKVQQQLWTFFLSGHNLTDANYYDHLSRLKQVDVHNMGRNISLGLVIPFGIYQGE